MDKHTKSDIPHTNKRGVLIIFIWIRKGRMKCPQEILLILL